MKLTAYIRLMRLDKPIGIILLWLPTACGLWLANHGVPPVLLVTYFLLGTISMRAAGCVINDIADRHIDKHVQRTFARPLTSGQLSLMGAFIALFLLLLVALTIAIQLPKLCFYYAFIGFLITIIYPFCKRFTHSPQLVLGIAFSMGIPMAYAACGAAPDQAMVILLLLNFFWTVAYDTMYAMVDRDDDLQIGVKSTAVLLGNFDRMAIGILLSCCHALWLYLGWLLNFPIIFYGCWLLAILVLLKQQQLVNTRHSLACFKAFQLSMYYGLVMWFAVIVGFLIR
ncbi:MAG: 4-hydroxybenzoate octaprenyltransferase [Legionella sp.]